LSPGCRMRLVQMSFCKMRPARAPDSPLSSWPGLTRPSTPFLQRPQDVDARHKAGHDDGEVQYTPRASDFR
ncbi:MAG: hypothetical protein ACLQJR_21235, partial [Stellaceae bacterium]